MTAGDVFASDASIKDPKDDRLVRWPFAKRIADTLAARSDPDSVVVGVHGRWGEGKSTVLEFVEHELRQRDGVVTVRFNPWLFADDAQLFRAFFKQLALALKRDLRKSRHKIGAWLQTYGAFFSGVSVAGVELSADLPGAGRSLAKQTPDELRASLEQALEQEDTRVVVFVDDIDRLDKDQVQAVFRLMKVAADFRWTSYVIACDREVLAAALGERYAGRRAAGEEFLEKIVQVPLTLPPVPRHLLRRLLIEDVARVLRDSGARLEQAGTRRFVRAVDDWLIHRIPTIRSAKRYVNALQFGLPLRIDTVDLSDFMLLEALRTLRPWLYELVSNHSQFLLGMTASTGQSRDRFRAEVAKLRAAEQFDERDGRVIASLFPDASKALDLDTAHGDSEKASWFRDKRIAHQAYYFSYFAAGTGELPDWQVEAILEQCPVDQDACERQLGALLRRVDPEILADKLVDLGAGRTGFAASAVGQVIARVAHLFPHGDDGLADITSARGRLAYLVAMLLASAVQHEAIALGSIFSGADLAVALHVFRLYQLETATVGPTEFGIGAALDSLAHERMGEELTGMVLKQHPPVWIGDLGREEFRTGLSLLFRHANRDALHQYLGERLDESPVRVCDLLRHYAIRASDDLSETPRFAVEIATLDAIGPLQIVSRVKLLLESGTTGSLRSEDEALALAFLASREREDVS